MKNKYLMTTTKIMKQYFNPANVKNYCVSCGEGKPHSYADYMIRGNFCMKCNARIDRNARKERVDINDRTKKYRDEIAPQYLIECSHESDSCDCKIKLKSAVIRYKEILWEDLMNKKRQVLNLKVAD